MRAYVLRKYGPPEVASLQDVPEPVPGPDELLVQVHAAGLNPIDYKFRNGLIRMIYRPTLPVVMGYELSGVVVGRGANVSRFSAGDRVFALCDFKKLGAFAEFACVDQQHAALVPDSLDFEPAAGVALAGMTALHCLRDQLHVQSGYRVLISGGAGGVGTFAIQIAKHLAAEVTATASPRGADLVRNLGADHVVDYTREKLDRTVHEFDGALDLVGGDTLMQMFATVKHGGRLVSVAGMPEPRTAREDLQAGAGLALLFWLASFRIRARARRHAVDYRYYFLHGNGDDLRELTRLIESGQLKPVVDRAFAFDEIAQALAYLEEGHAKGKVIVRMRQ